MERTVSREPLSIGMWSGQAHRCSADSCPLVTVRPVPGGGSQRRGLRCSVRLNEEHNLGLTSGVLRGERTLKHGVAQLLYRVMAPELLKEVSIHVEPFYSGRARTPTLSWWNMSWNCGRPVLAELTGGLSRVALHRGL